jgi:prepilin-type processing-associated H-X9-DG protein
MITEPLFTNAPVWGYADGLTQRHGTRVSAISKQAIGVLVTAAFFDGHVAPVDDDFANNLLQVQPDAQ